MFGTHPVPGQLFPLYPNPSAEMDIQWQGRWLEVLGAVWSIPNVKAVGYDQKVYRLCHRASGLSA